MADSTKKALAAEIRELRLRLQEAEDTLEAIRHGEVDALVVQGSDGDQIFSLRGAEHPYRVLVETINEGALTLGWDGTIFYSNKRLADMLETSLEKIIGEGIGKFVAPEELPVLMSLLTRGFSGPLKEELTFKTGNGNLIPTYVSSNLLGLPDFRCLCLVVTDLSEIKRKEAALLESENKLRLLSSQLFLAQERERRLLAAELHDELGQGLLHLKMSIARINKKLLPEQEDLQGTITNLLKYMDQVIDNVRRLYNSLSPAIIEDLGLTAALRHLLDEFAISHRIELAKCQIDNLDHLFSTKTQTILYRIIQELLTNVGKHAQATRLWFSGRLEKGEMAISIQDDGQGFDVEQVTTNPRLSGVGLASINERLRMLGGSLHVASQTNDGTRVIVNLPPETELRH